MNILLKKPSNKFLNLNVVLLNLVATIACLVLAACLVFVLSAKCTFTSYYYEERVQ